MVARAAAWHPRAVAVPLVIDVADMVDTKITDRMVARVAVPEIADRRSRG